MNQFTLASDSLTFSSFGLSAFGLSVPARAADGRTPNTIEALERIRESKPDVITLEVVMPGIDGWTVLKSLKADPQLSGIPVVPLPGVFRGVLRHRVLRGAVIGDDEAPSAGPR